MLSYIQIYQRAIDSYLLGREQFDEDDDLQRDGLIQRFEYTIELTWKTIKKILIYKGFDPRPTPSDILKTAEASGLQIDVGLFLDLIKSRNRFSHIYEEADVDDEFAFVASKTQAFSELIESMRMFIV